MTAEKKHTTAKTKKNTQAKSINKSAKKETPIDANNTPKPASKVIGSFADKILNLTNIGAKKIEDYATKSAKENDNKNALKLASAMKRFSHKLESGQRQYVDDVEKNAEELITLSKQTIGNLKKIYKEMKIRTKTAKDKAKKDVKICTENDTHEDMEE